MIYMLPPFVVCSSLTSLFRPETNHPPQQQQCRTFARSSEPSGETPHQKAVTFIITVGYSPDVARGVVDALEESGLSGDALLAACRQMAGRWEVGEDEGLEALAGSVEQLLKQKAGKQVVKIVVIPPNAWHSQEGQENLKETNEDRFNMMKRAFQVEALEGTSLTDIAKFGTGKGASTLGEYMECACSGIMACSTCHVVIEPGHWFQKVGEPSEAEQDMLDLAYSPRDTSRLGCQVVLSPELDGLVIRLPNGANNLMDFVPFED
jgi:2Fe-2S ferredoxin